MSIVLNDKQLTDNISLHHYHDDDDNDDDAVLAHGQTAVNSAAITVANATVAVTAGAAHASAAQHNNAKTIDADTYNLAAFDQCDGAWPIGHPLPLPMWSNESKAPLIVDKVLNTNNIYNDNMHLLN